MPLIFVAFGNDWYKSPRNNYYANIGLCTLFDWEFAGKGSGMFTIYRCISSNEVTDGLSKPLAFSESIFGKYSSNNAPDRGNGVEVAPANNNGVDLLRWGAQEPGIGERGQLGPL